MNSFEVQVTRGPHVESKHQVDAIVVNLKGETEFAAGDIENPVYPRSAIKMLQATLLVEIGASKAFALEQKHLAIASASHWADPIHTNLVGDWLKQLNLTEDSLICGAHEPSRESVRNELIRNNKKPNKIFNNCSGKHAGLLSVCIHKNIDPKNYGNYSHPVQLELRKKLSELYDVNLEKYPWGCDGCGIPTSAVPLKTMAQALARFSSKQSGKEILQAIAAHPDLIAGDSSFCTEVTRITQGRVFAKTGAEGVFAALDLKQGLFFALKVRDGASRASYAGIANLLKQKNCFSASEEDKLGSFLNPLIKNWSDNEVGEIRSVIL